MSDGGLSISFLAVSPHCFIACFMIYLKSFLHSFFRQVSFMPQKLPSSLKQTLDNKPGIFISPATGCQWIFWSFLFPFPSKNHKKIGALCTCTHTCEEAETNAQVRLNDKKSYFFLWRNFQSKKTKPTGSKNEKLCLKVVKFTPAKYILKILL